MDRIDKVSVGETSSSSNYNANAVIRHFDDFGIHEWERLLQAPSDEVSLYVHTHYLEKYIARGQRILEIGAGAGRFTQLLARLGARSSC
jgi:2-polyprenyl-3-methyl-5-hydroxy-6-metoxy-1,4-benzoquinol methylase